MNGVDIYDYYYLDEPYRKFDDRCEYGLCDKSILFRRIRSAVEEGRIGKSYKTPLANGKETEKDGSRHTTDVLDYMMYNVSGDTGLPAHYTCCMYLYKKVAGDDASDTYVENGHVCNAIAIMIGSRLEKKVLTRLAEMLSLDISDIYDEDYLHKIYSGSYLVNGTFYYSLFRESNNNKVCHNSKSKYRGDETVAYFYDNTCNRGVKLFTKSTGHEITNSRDDNILVNDDDTPNMTDRSMYQEELILNDRDGEEVTNVTTKVMFQLYKECLNNPQYYTLNMDLIKGFFSSVKRQGLTGIDNFKNKIYTNYSIGLNTFLDKLPSTAMDNPMWNASLLVGKVNLGISQRLIYPKSKSETKKQNEQKLKMCTGGKSTGYLIETQRRRNVRKTRSLMSAHCGKYRKDDKIGTGESKPEDDEVVDSVKISSRQRTVCGKRKTVQNIGQRLQKRRRLQDPPTYSSARVTETESVTHTILGSKDVKAVGLIERLENNDRSGPSTFNQVSVSYLPLIKVLSNTVQKLQVEHVHAESSKTVPRDAYGFICMKYMGNIATAGKNMLFTERVQVSYGHVHMVIEAVEEGINALTATHCQTQQATPFGLVIRRGRKQQNPPNGDWMYVVINNAVSVWSVSRKRLWEFVVYLKTRCHRFAWTRVVDDYLCIYYYEGVALLRYERGESLFDMLSSVLAETAGEKEDSVLTGVDWLYISRDELETLASMVTMNCEKNDIVEKTNTLIDDWFMRSRRDGGYDGVEHMSLLAKHVDQYTEYTAPSKRSVSVNARKSACVNVYYQRAADLIRGFNIFVDPDGYEHATAKQVENEHGLPEWVTLRDFARARAEPANCPQPVNDSDQSLDNFYMFRTIFADIDGFNVEDANVLDASVDLNLSFTYSFSLTFVDRTNKGLDIIVPPPRNAACVCSWDANGDPNIVLFMVCTLRRRDGEECSTFRISEMLRNSADVRMVTTAPGGRDCDSRTRRSTVLSDDTVSFPPFRKLSVIQSSDGNYHVYFMRNDAVLLRSVEKLRQRVLGAHARQQVPDMSNATRLAENAYAFACKPEVNVYDALTSLNTTHTSFKTSANERVVTVDIRVHGRSDKYDGVKIVNSFGQKGLALIKDLRPYFCQDVPASHNVPVQLVMNNCSFVSRQPIGQCLQVKKNMYATVLSAAREPTIVGYTPVFLTETEPDTKTCLVRLDEMMRSVIITLGLTIFQNLKCSLDNVYNPYGVLYPPQTRQIMSLYRCVGVSYNFAGDTVTPFSTRDDVQALIDLYDMYTQTPKHSRVTTSRALLNLMEALHKDEKRKRLIEVGALREINNGSVCDDGSIPSHTYLVHLDGQWIDGHGSFDDGGGDARKPNYELRSYNSLDGVYRTAFVYGDPCLIEDVINEKYAYFNPRIKYTPTPTRTDHKQRRNWL